LQNLASLPKLFALASTLKKVRVSSASGFDSHLLPALKTFYFCLNVCTCIFNHKS